MILSWSLPLTLMLISREEIDLKLPIVFSYKELECNISFDIEYDHREEEAQDQKPLFYKVTKLINFTLKGSDEAGRNKIALISSDEKKLTKTISQLTNRVLRNIRLIGRIPSAREITNLSDETILYSFKPHLIQNDDVQNLYHSPVNPFFRTKPYSSPVIDIEASKWTKIVEGIINDAPSSPEIELLVNAYDHLEAKNFRLAVLESVIGLEIALTTFMKEYLVHFKGFDDKKIKAFLSSEFTLSTRLSGLLDLTIDPEHLKGFNIQKVKTVVSWRNNIVHITGNIDKGISEDQLRDGIAEVISLIYLLHGKKGIVPKLTSPPLFGQYLI
ncbi:hypothetical protein ACFVVQ_10775 [Paenibacillus chitinolyticus]|uniref:hypothetical protein n=1 Tax=Paenibacillus chitinolyticus TaxID=79263 RepID=UPI0036D89576